MSSDFPRRVYTQEEVGRAKKLVDEGYKHNIAVKGSLNFKRKVGQALKYIETAGQHDFLRMYIRDIVEIDGLTQLREADAAIWANKYAVENSVDAASIFVQKANRMKEYLDGKLYYGGEAEKRSVNKRIEFLELLKSRTREETVKEMCEKLLKMWSESSLAY